MAFFESRTFILSLRAVQAILTVLVLGLTGYGKLHLTVVDDQNPILTSQHSRQLVGRLLERQRAL
jgi:hypothetical protein